ncbi:hypothetical protein RCCGE510_19994 [Rhizobium sp. CCGE 510]|nr:hypothetical protein RCCGE510_19994 [Rhizobium sp. CCGE 510]
MGQNGGKLRFDASATMQAFTNSGERFSKIGWQNIGFGHQLILDRQNLQINGCRSILFKRSLVAHDL